MLPFHMSRQQYEIEKDSDVRLKRTCDEWVLSVCEALSSSSAFPFIEKSEAKKRREDAELCRWFNTCVCQHMSAFVSICRFFCQHFSAIVSSCQRMSAHLINIRRSAARTSSCAGGSAPVFVSICQHLSAFDSICHVFQHMSANFQGFTCRALGHTPKKTKRTAAGMITNSSQGDASAHLIRNMVHLVWGTGVGIRGLGFGVRGLGAPYTYLRVYG